jgi:hypothetical protein
MQTLDSSTPAVLDEQIAVDLPQICRILFDIAQLYTPASAFSDTSELLRIAKIMQDIGIPVTPLSKIKAALSDHSSNVTTQSSEYRLLKARYAACLSTIADLANKTPVRVKTVFQSGVHEGLRRAAKIAIMFLDDIMENKPLKPKNNGHKKSSLTR